MLLTIIPNLFFFILSGIVERNLTKIPVPNLQVVIKFDVFISKLKNYYRQNSNKKENEQENKVLLIVN